jgi:poly [ADP-ribose] polymerase 2/3/4
LKEYFDNTKEGYKNVTISDIFEVNRPVEHSSFNKKLGNNMLLWHGSRVSNFVGILSQGMRIAPPEAPASGYLFGKGIYLADMAEKSINYCRAYGQPDALILLIEVRLPLFRAQSVTPTSSRPQTPTPNLRWSRQRRIQPNTTEEKLLLNRPT